MKVSYIVEFLLVTILLTSSCSSYKQALLPKKDTADWQAEVEAFVSAGKHYKIYPKDSKPFLGKVTEVSNHQIAGLTDWSEDVPSTEFRIPISELKDIRPRKFSVLKTTGAIVLPFVVIGGISLAASGGNPMAGSSFTIK